MKKLFLMILIMLTLLLCACANVSINYSLNDDFVVAAEYNLNFENTDEDVSEYMLQIGSYWEQLGFELTENSDQNTLQGRKEIMLEDAKQAAEQFASLITSEDTMFYDVSFSYEPSFEIDRYDFSASITLEDVIRQDNAQGLSAEQIKEVLDSASDGKYSVSISLPGEVISTNADSIKDGICTWNIEFGETKALFLHTKRLNQEKLDLYDSLNKRASANQTWLIVSIVIAAAALIAAILTLIVRQWRKRKSSKIHVE